MVSYILHKLQLDDLPPSFDIDGRADKHWLVHATYLTISQNLKMLLVFSLLLSGPSFFLGSKMFSETEFVKV